MKIRGFQLETCSEILQLFLKDRKLGIYIFPKRNLIRKKRVAIYYYKYFSECRHLVKNNKMETPLHIKVREEIGANLKKHISKITDETALRKIDSLTGKDHSWIGKVFNGKMNLTIDSLTMLILAYKLKYKDVFNVEIDYSKISEQELWDYLISMRKRKKPKKARKKK